MGIKKERMKKILLWVVVLAAFIGYGFLFYVPEGKAIPAFARKYNFACNTCHVPSFPKLNDFGNVFRDQGFQLGSEEDLPTFEGITMGFWPVSFRTTVGYQSASLRADGSGISSGSFGFTGLDILSFGTLARNVTFGMVLTPSLGSAGFGTGGSDGDLEAAFVRLDNLERFLGVKKEDSYLLNLKVGKFEIDAPFSEKRSPTLNTPFVMYHYSPGTPFTTLLGDLTTLGPGYANPNDFQIGENQPAAELFGYTTTPGDGYFRYALELLSNSNINGTGLGGGRGFTFFGHVTQSLGGYGIVRGQRIGLFGAVGDAPTLPNQVSAMPANPDPGLAGGGKRFSRIGADMSLTYDGQWNLFGAYMYARDSQGIFARNIATAQSAKWHGAFVELDWYPTLLPFVGQHGWMFIYRYDLIRNEQQGDKTFASNFNDVNSHTVMARYNFHLSTRTDVALHLEFNTTEANNVGALGGDGRSKGFLAGFDFAL